MQGDQHPALVLLRTARERVLEALSEAFRRDEIGLDEFEARVDRAYAAPTPDELTKLVSDLSPVVGASPVLAVTDSSVASRAGAPPASLALAPHAGARRRGPVAIFASVERGGRFVLESGYRAVAILGNVELDLREVAFPPGVTELFVRAVMGNVEITVPPHLAVECEGGALFGSFSAVNRRPAEGAEERPVLRVIGSAVFGNVEVHTRPTVTPASHALQLGPRDSKRG
jgi:hypothetical protein